MSHYTNNISEFTVDFDQMSLKVGLAFDAAVLDNVVKPIVDEGLEVQSRDIEDSCHVRVTVITPEQDEYELDAFDLDNLDLSYDGCSDEEVLEMFKKMDITTSEEYVSFLNKNVLHCNSADMAFYQAIDKLEEAAKLNKSAMYL